MNDNDDMSPDQRLANAIRARFPGIDNNPAPGDHINQLLADNPRWEPAPGDLVTHTIEDRYGDKTINTGVFVSAYVHERDAAEHNIADNLANMMQGNALVDFPNFATPQFVHMDDLAPAAKTKEPAGG